MDKQTELESLERDWQDAENRRQHYRDTGEWWLEGEQARRTIELEQKIRALNPDWRKP